ncbi:hypothetical protein PIB30_016178 [Stylosanthes scabra]|uniref:Uncharacterized protein n=1 Tax=Stylosanthes scabra TaxID=79078 RepID=A0ABU6U677_9FABA|nr:hypothetical protein [Stylosanthes scabra]
MVSTGGGVSTTTSYRPFRLPQSENGPNPQSNAEGNQNQRIDEEEVSPLANEVHSFDDHVDRSFEASDARNSRGRKNAKPWTVDIIAANGTIKEREKMTVAQAMKPLHGTKETFYFDDQSETIKGMMLQSLGNSWKEARNRLFHEYYDPRKTLEKNVDARLGGIDEDHWRRFLRYHLRLDIKEKCRKNTVNRSKQLYTHMRFQKPDEAEK